VTQPRYAMWIVNRRWSVENHGVDPDVEVPVPPQAWAQGLDPQLDTAVELALAALAQTPAATRADHSRPSVHRSTALATPPGSSTSVSRPIYRYQTELGEQSELVKVEV
jgi:C-terminal processing protease CtpA/Prc